MTVRELIAALSALTPEQQDLPVETEGCDDCGPADGVAVAPGERFTGEPCVVITRRQP